MARITNSDTLQYVDSRYELSMLATQRVRDLNGGAEPVVPAKKDKLTVLSLREIGSGKLDIDKLRHTFVQSYKSVPTGAEAEHSIESSSEDPLLKELDTELESVIIESESPAEEVAESLPEESTESEEENQ
ncbi:MAG: DNA-directed RNA polymerase subunit omega [Alphaproteobacteria bacterium]